MVLGLLACNSFLHRITTFGETTSRYLSHGVENTASFMKVFTINL